MEDWSARDTFFLWGMFWGALYAIVCMMAEKYIPGWPLWVGVEVAGGVILVWLLLRQYFARHWQHVLTAADVLSLFLLINIAVGLPITVWQVARALFS